MLGWRLGFGGVRAKVRSRVRAKVGSRVRAKARSRVRAKVRSRVGAKVRSRVGAKVGSRVGAKVGSRVGAKVGISDSRGASIDLVGAHVVLSLPLHLITLGRAAGQHLEAGG